MCGVVNCLAGCALDELATELFVLKEKQQRRKASQHDLFNLTDVRENIYLYVIRWRHATWLAWPALGETSFE